MDKKPKLGDCFEKNGKVFLKLQKQGLLLCHGIVENSVDNKPMVHCWVEYSKFYAKGIRYEMVIDKSNGHDAELPKDWYYEIGKVSEVVKYNKHQYREKLFENGFYGPWELDFKR